MSNTNTGGPAFPFPAYTYPNDEINHGEGGMTLRDYFAAKALQGICASGPTTEWSNTRLAIESYEMADAMIRTREAA